jgi:hypothetical protein
LGLAVQVLGLGLATLAHFRASRITS